MRYSSLLCSLVLCSTALTLRAQEAPTESGPHLRVDTQLVVLDTVVTDRSNHVITNLTQNDFVVYENGVPQIIRNFSAPAEHTDIPAHPAKDRNGHDDWGSAPLTMIVLDELDTPFNELAYARDSVRNYLRAQPTQLAEPTILLWLNDDGFHPLTFFTRDRDGILAALARQPASFPSKLSRGAAAEQVAASFAALQQAALFSRGQPGKKELIWVGRSFPSIDPTGLTGYDRTLINHAVRSTLDVLLASRVTLYVIDPTITGSARDDDDAAQEVDTLTPAPGTSVADPFAASFNLNLFVSQTGGKYFRGFNDLDHEITASVQRGNAYYTLAYTPNPAIHDGTYRHIDIRLKNPAYTAHTKQGYYAESGTEPTQTSLTQKLEHSDLRFDLYEASVTGMQYSGVGLHVQSCVLEPNRISASCYLSVDLAALTFASSTNNEQRTTVLAVLSSLNAKGKLINDSIERITIAIPESQTANIETGHSIIHVRTIVPPGTRTLRAIVRDTSGRIGTAEVYPATLASITASPAAIEKARHK